MHKKSFIAAMLAFAATAPALALQSVLVGSGFEQPVFLTAPTGDSRLFVVEKTGRIKVLQDGAVSTFLDIRSLVDTSGERGLLGLAFDPAFSSNGRFYVDYIDKSSKNTVVAAFTGPSALPSSGQFIIGVTQPNESNHKAGWIGFRPGDGNQLYVATGDGGSGNDPSNNAQDLGSDLGKILRITPTAGGGYTVPTDNPFPGASPGSKDEIWAYGLRNPYRNSFDRLSGDFWIADVGQGAREELNFEVGSRVGGRNYGWRPREGSIPTPGVNEPRPPGATDPIFEYTHNGGDLGKTIIGGYVYHGGEPGMDGKYIFGDFVSGGVFSLRYSGGAITDFTNHTAELGAPFGSEQFGLSSFGQDGIGNIYALSVTTGNIYRIAAVPEPGTWMMLVGGLLTVNLWVRRRTARCPRQPGRAT